MKREIYCFVLCTGIAHYFLNLLEEDVATGVKYILIGATLKVKMCALKFH